MRIGLYTWGSEGDVRPFVALACGLRKAGHEVSLAYVAIDGRDWSGACAPFGIASRSIAAAPIAKARTTPGPHLDALVGKGHALAQVEAVVAGLLDPAIDDMWDDASRTARDHDVVVAHLLYSPALAAAALHGKKLVTIAPAPITPTRHLPPMGMPSLGPLNVLSWKLADVVGGRWLLPRVNGVRARAGLPPVRTMFPRPNPEVALALTCVSPTLVPRPGDWDPVEKIPGYFELPEAAHPWEPPPELRAFLDAGEPPVLMTFGSMLAMANDETTYCVRTLLEAAEIARCRALVQAPWTELPELPRSERVLRLGRAPHTVLLASSAAMVHHGGAGTTQAACLAGRPSVVVPFLGDQTFWAGRLRALGIAPPALLRAKLEPRGLAQRIRAVLDGPAMRARAETVAASMRREDGVARAVEWIAALA